MILIDDGQVLTTGHNKYGALGLSDYVERTTFTLISSFAKSNNKFLKGLYFMFFSFNIKNNHNNSKKKSKFNRSWGWYLTFR